ncbi:MAG: sensor histidine kinase [Gaiellales bacterium]
MEEEAAYSRWRLVLGPWPFAPTQIVIFGMIAFAARTIVIAGAASSTGAGLVGVVIFMLAQGALITLATVATIIVVGGWRRHEVSVPTRPRYILACFAGAAVATIGILLLRLVNHDALTGKGMYANLPVAAAFSFGFLVVLVFAISNGVGYTRFRVSQQTRRLRAQVDQLSRQRTLIVEADDRVRREVATALHDEVQGVLLRANLRLSGIAERVDADAADGIRDVVAELERLRGAGVRSIGRRIAPPIDAVGLATALDGLAATYAGSIDVAVEIADGFDAGERASAVYRIVEQALLNAAAHGRATHADVVVQEEDGVLSIRVDDDGVGPAPRPTPGTGMAMIEAWVGTFGGSWSLAPRAEGGARLTASVPV